MTAFFKEHWRFYLWFMLIFFIIFLVDANLISFIEPIISILFSGYLFLFWLFVTVSTCFITFAYITTKQILKTKEIIGIYFYVLLLTIFLSIVLDILSNDNSLNSVYIVITSLFSSVIFTLITVLSRKNYLVTDKSKMTIRTDLNEYNFALLSRKNFNDFRAKKDKFFKDYVVLVVRFLISTFTLLFFVNAIFYWSKDFSDFYSVVPYFLVFILVHIFL